MSSIPLDCEGIRESPDVVHRSRPPVLFLTHRLPYPPDKGDRIRTYHILKTLALRSAVFLACLADEPPDQEALTALQPYCERVAVIRLGTRMRWVRAFRSLVSGGTVTEGAFQSPALESVLRHWTQEVRFHTAVASASSMAPYLRMKELRNVQALIDLVDVDSQKWLDYASACKGPRAWLYRTEGHRLRLLERSLSEWARALTLVSEAEVRLYRQCGGAGPIYAVTNGVDLDYFTTQSGENQQGCAFVGALDYRPNIDGIRWFCESVWPAIRLRHPEAKLTLVGRKPTPEVRRLANQPGVTLVGQVADVRPHMAHAAVMIAPLRIARGVQNKVLEALAMSKAIVASPQALKGLRVSPNEHLLSATTPAEWIEAVSQLLIGPDLRARLGEAGKEYVMKHHQWSQCLEPLSGLLGLNLYSISVDGLKDQICLNQQDNATPTGWCKSLQGPGQF